MEEGVASGQVQVHVCFFAEGEEECKVSLWVLDNIRSFPIAFYHYLYIPA